MGDQRRTVPVKRARTPPQPSQRAGGGGFLRAAVAAAEQASREATRRRARSGGLRRHRRAREEEASDEAAAFVATVAAAEHASGEAERRRAPPPSTGRRLPRPQLLTRTRRGGCAPLSSMKMLPSPTRHGEMRATTHSPASAGEAADEHGADRLPSTSSRRRPLPSRLKRSPPTSRWRRCAGAVEERRLRRARHGRWSSSSFGAELHLLR
nr:uncharacterized protein LOC127326002 [Lolium perenne]